MVAIHERLREEGSAARLVLQVHDELLLEVPDAEVAAVKELVREEMCSALPARPAARGRRRRRRRLERRQTVKVRPGSPLLSEGSQKPWKPHGYTDQLLDGQ